GSWPPLYKAGGCFLRHQLPRRKYRTVRSLRFPHGLLDNRDELLNTKRLLDAGNACFLECGGCLLVGDVASGEDQARGKLRAILCDPSVNIGAINASWRAHVGDDPEEVTGLELA